MDAFLQVGVISSTHGLKGEVKVYPTTDDPERFLDLDHVQVEDSCLHIQSVKFFKQFVILKFRELNDISQVEQLKGKALMITREQAVPLEDNEYFIADLLGMQVYTDTGELLGELTDVITTAANDVYEVKLKDGGTVLLPAIRDCILKVDPGKGTMTVHVMNGLL